MYNFTQNYVNLQNLYKNHLKFLCEIAPNCVKNTLLCIGSLNDVAVASSLYKIKKSYFISVEILIKNRFSNAYNSVY